MAHHFGPLITPQTFELLPKIVVETKLTFTNTSIVNGILLSVESRFSSSILDVIRHEKRVGITNMELCRGSVMKSSGLA